MLKLAYFCQSKDFFNTASMIQLTNILGQVPGYFFLLNSLNKLERFTCMPFSRFNSFSEKTIARHPAFN